MKSSIAWITGSTGFLGSKFKKKLVEKYDIVVIFLRNNKTEYLSKEKEKIKNFSHLNYAPDSLYLLATLFNIKPTCNKDIKEIFESNYFFNLSIVELFIKLNGSRIIYTSSYFQDLPSKYRTHYSISKQALLEYLESLNVSLYNFYIYDSFGQGDRRNKLLDRLILECKKNKMLAIPKNNILINYCLDEDIVFTILTVIGKFKSGSYSVYNPKSVKLGEVVNLIFDTLRIKRNIKFSAESENFLSLVKQKNCVFFQEKSKNILDQIEDYIIEKDCEITNAI